MPSDAAPVGPETLNYVAAVSRMWQAIEGCR